LRSGAAILSALRTTSSTEDRRGPASVVEIECGADGRWVLEGVDYAPGACLAQLDPRTVFMLALHGGAGEDGTIQGLLESHGCVHAGSGVAASALCMNKHATRLVLQQAGLAVAPARLIHPIEWESDSELVSREVIKLSRQGWSVKPNCGGSSVSTYIVTDTHDLGPAIERVLATGDRALVERRIVGVEATCGVLGNERGRLHALTPVEIVPHAGRFFDYQEKYSAGGAEEFCPPRSLPPETSRRIQELSLIAHRAAGCDGYSRVDYIVPCNTPGSGGEPVALEINTLPGMTSRSLMPKAAATEGLDLRDLLLEILGLALARAGARP
jgi:D-alanine-D-alanine ligase